MEKMVVGIPTGIIFPYAGTNEPAGFMLCDGRSLSRAAYPGLFSVIGTAHGAADGSSFNIPDYRGRFLRGVDGTAGWDPDKGSRTAMRPGGATGNAVGTVQGSNNLSHSHGITDPGHSHIVYSGFNNNTNGGNYHPPMANANDYNRSTSGSYTGISVNSSGGSESRPVNAYVNYIIKV